MEGIDFAKLDLEEFRLNLAMGRGMESELERTKIIHGFNESKFK